MCVAIVLLIKPLFSTVAVAIVVCLNSLKRVNCCIIR